LGVQQAVDGAGKLIDSSQQEKGPEALEAFQPIGRQMRFEFDDDVSAIEPRWEPGKTAGYHLYSSWFVLGEIIQRLTGRSFSEHARSSIFGPL